MVVTDRRPTTLNRAVHRHADHAPVDHQDPMDRRDQPVLQADQDQLDHVEHQDSQGLVVHLDQRATDRQRAPMDDQAQQDPTARMVSPEVLELQDARDQTVPLDQPDQRVAQDLPHQAVVDLETLDHQDQLAAVEHAEPTAHQELRAVRASRATTPNTAHVHHAMWTPVFSANSTLAVARSSSMECKSQVIFSTKNVVEEINVV